MLSNPRLWNYLLICLYVVAAGRWAYARNWPQALYWFGAIIINGAATWGMSK